jgi:hypothetical protein
MKDQNYIDQRNKLIPVAEQYANEKEGHTPKPNQERDAWANNWNRAFHGEMNRLAKQSGLIK